ncbi:MAG: PAS domain-containing protein [Firmicutes bacterium]|nr:PAS domain-containing protein [Bacillota bacterium]
MSNSNFAGGGGFILATQILDQVPTPFFAVDKELKLLYMNSAGCKFLGKPLSDMKGKLCYDEMGMPDCESGEYCLAKAIREDRTITARSELNVKGHKIPIEFFVAPLKDNDGNIVGGLEYFFDISQKVKNEERLREQARTIREISTPAIKLWEGIVVLPVVGIIDSVRAQQMMDTILAKITETSSRVVILDIQGVAAVDTAVANHLMKITKATKLMGCQCIISGISPAVAQTIVHLGIDMTGIRTNATLKDALLDAFGLINLEVRHIKPSGRI